VELKGLNKATGLMETKKFRTPKKIEPVDLMEIFALMSFNYGYKINDIKALTFAQIKLYLSRLPLMYKDKMTKENINIVNADMTLIKEREI
jgi:hypothetical protein